MGAGPARSTIEPVPQPTQLAMVTVNIAQVGSVDAMVDSGAMVSVIRRNVVENILKEENKIGGHVVSFDRMKVPVIGEMTLSVRFEGVLAELRRVKIVEHSLYDMILGAEWVEKSNVIIYSDAGRLLARVRPQNFNLPTLKLNPNDPLIKDSCSAVASLVVSGLVADGDAQQVVFPTAPGRCLQSDWPVSVAPRSERCSTYPRTLEPIAEEVPETSLPDEYLDFLGSISLNDDLPIPSSPFYAHVKKRTVLPPGGMRFIVTDVPCTAGDVWVVTKSFSSQPSREWIIPNCLVTASKKALCIPILNLSNQPLQWNEGNTLAAVELLQNTVVPLNVGNEVSDCVCSLADTSPSSFIPDNVKKDLNIGKNLSLPQQTQLFELLDRHANCFSINEKSTPTHGIEHHIDTGESQPIGCTLRRTSACERRLISAQVDDMLEKDVIEQSNSPWAAQVVMVPKRDGTRRFCIDYRPINSKTRRDLYPLPRMDEILERVTSAGDEKGDKFMTSLDLKNGFWQVPIREQDREKTAFVTSDGLFHFKRMPFGLCNSPATFQRLMDQVLRHLKWSHCLVYLDDVAIFADSFETHLERLDAVLTALGAAGLKLNPAKCTFATDSMHYLGHLIDSQGIRPDPRKLAAIDRFPIPTDVSSLRSFLGIASYYRRFILSYARLAAPLHQLLKKGVKWSWTEKEQRAMRDIQDALLAAPTLVCDNDVCELELKTDASKIGLGAVLSRVDAKGERPITFISRGTTPAERNYCSNELECCALVWALGKLRHHLYGRRFTVWTDNVALKWLHSKKDVEGKLARWILALQEFDIDVRHLKGDLNVVADALSRFPVGTPEDTDPTDHIVCALVGSYHPPQEVALLQQGDPSLRDIILRLRDSPVDPVFTLHEHCLYRKNVGSGHARLLVVPSFLRREVLQACHDEPSGGHMGIEKTLAKISQCYWWPEIKKSVVAYVSSCTHCQFNKPMVGRPIGKLMSIPPPEAPFDTLGADHLGPFKLTARKNLHVLVLIDYLTKWLMAIPVMDLTTESVIRALREQVIPQHGVMKRIITDKGSSFTSHSLSQELNRLGVQHVLATTERPQTNGLVERSNRTLVSVIKSFINVDQNNWDEHLPSATLCINTAKQSSTRCSPFELVYGRPATMPHQLAFSWPSSRPLSHRAFVRRVIKWRTTARRLIEESQRKSKLQYDKCHRHATRFERGDLVLVARRIRITGKTEKLLPKFIGPFQVVRRKCENTYLVEDVPVFRRRRSWVRFNAHVAQLRPFRVRDDFDWRPENEEGSVGDDWMDAPSPSTSLDSPMDTPGLVIGPLDEPVSETIEPLDNPITETIEPPAPVTTRIGRVVRRPGQFRDFVMSTIVLVFYFLMYSFFYSLT